jgi:fibrillarin-like rRNA methylase
LKREGQREWRNWIHRRSKLGAGLLRTRRDPALLLPDPGSTIIYLGAGHGSTVSHLHDHLCGADNQHQGRLICVDISPRCMRDLLSLAALRPGLIPLLADARKLDSIETFVPQRVDWLFQDVSQAGQAGIFLDAARRFLNPGGRGLLSLKAASERRGSSDDAELYAAAMRTLEAAGMQIEELITLTGWEEQHALIVATAPQRWDSE